MSSNVIEIPKNIKKINYEITFKKGGYFRTEFLTVNSLIYFSVLTLITLITFIYGYKILLDLTSNNKVYFLFSIFLFTFYILFLGMFYLNWNLETIFLLILMGSILFGFVSFLIIYFGNDICTEISKEDDKKFMKYIVIFLEFIVIYLGFYNRHNYDWNMYDSMRFILMLIIIRTIYYIVRHFNLPIYKTIIDVTMVIVLYINGYRMYKILNKSRNQINMKNVGNLKIIKEN